MSTVLRLASQVSISGSKQKKPVDELLRGSELFSLTKPVNAGALRDQSTASYVEKTKEETGKSRGCLWPGLYTQDETDCKLHLHANTIQ